MSPHAPPISVPLLSPTEREYASLLAAIKQRLRDGQYAALRAVNVELISLYWDVGRLIVQRQQGQSWGQAVVARLARDLRAVHPGTGGLSASNLWRMKLFYEAYAADEKLAPLVREIGWSHNLLILERCTEPLEREFYLRMTRRFGWSKRTLAAQIERGVYAAMMSNRTNFDTALSAPTNTQARLALKDEYTFDFLDLGDEYTERELEIAILRNVGPFLREMGGTFAFVDSQFPLTVAGKQYFLDLLLYNRALKALTAIELKSGEFQPEHVGKMQFYLAVLDDTVRTADENPSIGIILCKSGDRTVVEYAIQESRRPIGVATYRLVSVPPPELARHLPAPEQIAKLLEGVG
jgi:predicted nuclease of restriction endonuclease-like (RecB) superfamily